MTTILWYNDLLLLRGMGHETVYFGTYTRRLSKGIYIRQIFDTETGQLCNLEPFAKLNLASTLPCL